ncbi:protein red1 [Rhypophila sp. PSN 637]
MSQYPPPNGYGQYYGHPPSQQYGYQLPPNPFNQPYNSAFMETASNTVQSSFNFNANQIPGLGIAGGQGLISQSDVPTAGDLIQASSASDSSVNQNQGTAIPLEPAPKTLIASTTHPAMDADFEEGELNEEQFEDLYEPQVSIEQTSAVRERLKLITSASNSGVASAADTPDAGFYGNDEADKTDMDGNKKGHNGRERSGSYSPFLSPRGTPPNKHIVPGLHVPAQGSTNGPSGFGNMQPQHAQEIHHALKSVEEGRKEAQKAILRLWSLGVRFQHYIDEGHDEGLIRSLFNQLNLEINDGQSSQKEKSTVSKPGQPMEKQQPQKSETAAPPPKPHAALPGDTKSAGEERKDRIARLLAAKKAAKPSTPLAQSQPQTKPPPKAPEKKDVPFSPPKAPAAMTRSKVWGEKEILLQQKIAALQEAQARKAAKAKTNSGPSQIAGNGPGTLTQPPVDYSVKSGPSAAKNGPGPAQSVEKSTNSETASSIPGLLLAIPTGPARNQRKRPVASDFVDVAPATRPNKRPFGQHHKETSLVIDVSDASEGEEMDIDAESPLEDSSSFLPNLASQRGLSIRDFPPLTNTPPQRQFSSPAPSSNNPVGHPILSRKRETELDIKEKEIQEMRRKIAEIEARRKAKQSSGGPLTPTQTAQTPESKDNEQPSSGSDREASAQLASTTVSVQLPKKPDLSHASPKVERRGRIVSLDLPRIDETIEEKMNRLRQLREEEMRLQAEIDSQLAKKRLLTEELEQLGDTLSDDALQANGSDATSGGNQPTSAAISITSDQNDVAVDVPMDEDGSSVADEPTTGDASTASPKVTTDGEIVEQEPSPAPQEAQEQLSQLVSDYSEPNDSIHGTNPIPRPDANESLEVDQRAGSPASDDDPAPMDIESSSPSPSANLTPFSNDVVNDETQPAEPSSSEAVLEQLSSATKSREAVQEIEGQPTREVHVVLYPLNLETEQQPKSGFVPYESPLRYFRAYRFHPSYPETVRGGMKSLTYNNQIDPQKPFCPTELAGEQCPADCEFQHLRSIGVPADKILLDLGKSSDYSGEQKSRFVQGLRKLLGDIRERGCTDFETIAREIVAFRASFLGDRSKILPLGGVTV